MERAAGLVRRFHRVASRLVMWVPVLPGGAGKGIKKAGGLIWPTARVLSGRRSCRLRLARDGHRSPAIPRADRRHGASEIQQHLHSETASKYQLARARDLHTGGQSRRVAGAVSTSSDDDVGQATDDVGRGFSRPTRLLVLAMHAPCSFLGERGINASRIESAHVQGVRYRGPRSLHVRGIPEVAPLTGTSRRCREECPPDGGDLSEAPDLR
jgi:hypothetical protein